MLTQSLHQPAKKEKNATALVQGSETVSNGTGTSTSRPATPSILDRLKGRFKRTFRSSAPKRTKAQVSPPPPDANQPSIEPIILNASLIVPGMNTPFEGAPDDRAGEIEIYNRGIKVVGFLQELAGLTGPGLPNPVPSILKALTGVLTQLQQMVKNEGEWKELFLLISKHLETFNRQLQLLELGSVKPDSASALHQPIVQYSATLREMTAKILDDAGFDPTSSKEKSDWNQLVDFFGKYWHAGEVPGKIGDYRKQLSEAMVLLLRDQVLFTAVKVDETNTVVKETSKTVKETNTGVNRLLQIMDEKSVLIGTTGKRVHAKSLPVISPYFVVRRQEMGYMEKQVIESESMGQRVFAVIGMGGSGKTQLVSHFVQEINKGKTLFTLVVFVDASSGTNLETDLQSWARSLGVGHETDDWNNCLQYLANGPHEGRWVLIFDNADDPTLKLKRFFPRCSNGTILITSRNPGVEHLATVGHLELERMSTEDALATLESAAGRQIPEDSKEFESAQLLMQELGCLPLALVHAGTYCRSQSSGEKSQAFTFNQYHSLFRKRRAALMKKPGSFTQDDYEHGVYTTLDMSYRAVKTPSKRFLHIISNYHYAEIPFAMFLVAANENFKDPYQFLSRSSEHPNVVAQLNTLLCPDGEPDEFQLRELTEDLRSFSLILPGESSLFLRMHPLVQAWVRDMLSKDGYDYQTMATQIVTSCCLDNNRPLHRYLLPHINEISETKGGNIHVNDRLAFARVLDSGGRYKDAGILFEEALESLQQVFEEETADMVTVKLRLATSYWNQGRWEEAKKLQVYVLERRQKILGADHPDSLMAANDLALTYSNQGRWDEAERLQIDVLKKRHSIQGADHPDSLMVANNLALTYWNQGRWDEAEKLQVEVLENQKRVLGADHPDSIMATNNLAATYQNQGRWDEAERLQIDVLKMRHSIQGANHPDSLMAANNLAFTYRNQGCLDAAEKLAVDVLERQQRIVGADHPVSLTAASNLATIYLKQGRLDEAEKLDVYVLERTQMSLGVDHPDSILAAENLAVTYSSQARWLDAEPILERVVEQSIRVMRQQHPDTQKRIHRIVEVYEKLEKLDKALEMKVLLIS